MNPMIQVVRDSIQSALEDVRSQSITDPKRAKQNRRRSATFLKILGEGILHRLQAMYPTPNIAVLSGSVKHTVFNRKEYLFDLHALEYEFFESPVHHKLVPYIRRSVIQLESEFEPSATDVSSDLSKLVCGNAPTKALIATEPRDIKRYLRSISPVASRITGSLLVALLPHPKTWTPRSTRDGQAFSFQKGGWISIPPSSVE